MANEKRLTCRSCGETFVVSVEAEVREGQWMRAVRCPHCGRPHVVPLASRPASARPAQPCAC